MLSELLSNDDNIYVSRDAIHKFGVEGAVILGLLYAIHNKPVWFVTVEELCELTKLSESQVKRVLSKLGKNEMVVYIKDRVIISAVGLEYYVELEAEQ